MGTYRVIKRATPPTLGKGEDQQPNPFAVSIGGGYYHVEPRYVLEKGDTLAADEINGKTWDTFPGKAPLHSAKVMRARAYRRANGQSLRAEVGNDVSVTVGKGVPQSGKASKAPDNPGKALEALALAKALHEADPDAVMSVTVPMSDVLDGDVVDSDLLPPHHWSYNA